MLTEDQFNSMVTEDGKATHVLSGSLNMPVFVKVDRGNKPYGSSHNVVLPHH